jgi:PAS domain S-box-containing protein
LKLGEKDYLSDNGADKDITNLKRLEELLENERKLRTIFDNTFQFIGLLTTDGILISVNKAAAESVGAEQSSLLNKPFWDCPWWTHSRQMQEKLQQAVKEAAQGQFVRFEATHPTKDGTLIYVDFSLKPVKDENGKVIYLLPEGRNITDRKLSEEEHNRMLSLQQSVNSLQQLLLKTTPLEEKLKKVTDDIVNLFEADFCRIWLIRNGDLCRQGCIHAEVKEGPHVCIHRDRCLHLVSSSGRYTHIDGKTHRRVPFGCYKIGRVASDEEHKFLTNDVQNDPRVHDHQWAGELGLVSFVGYQLRIEGGQTLGVLALFSKHPIQAFEDAMLDGISSTVSLAVQQALVSKQLLESEQKYRELFESSRDSIMTLEPPSWKFTSCNPATLRLFKVETEEKFTSLGPWEVSPSQQPDGRSSADKAKEMIERALKEGSNFFEWTHKRINEEPFPATVLLTRMERGGKVLLQATVRDITEPKRAEEELRKSREELELRVMERTAELQDANEQLQFELAERKRAEQKQTQLVEQVKKTNDELNDFAYIVSHDLKAPLRGIRTLAEWIVTDYADKIDENGKEQMRLLTTRVDRMFNLIEGVLRYSRVGREKENVVEVNLNELVREVVDMVSPPENFEITVKNELPIIKCDKTRLSQVFQNLLSNAVKYMDKPKGLIQIGCIKEEQFWKFSVSDNGPGIDKKDFERIFKVFQTLAPHGTFESTGIGLTVVKKIVELYGGKIWLESKVGEGSTFFFTLPKQAVEATDAVLEADIVGARG